MAQCEATKANGERCKVAAMPGASTCWGHDPAKAEQRRAIARKGGQTGGQGRPASHTELAELRTLLKGLTGAALKGTYERGTVAVVNQVIQSRLRLVEVERRLYEQDELEARLAALEAQLAQGSVKRWG